MILSFRDKTFYQMGMSVMILHENGLTPEIYASLRGKVGFSPYLEKDVAVALENSTYTVVAEVDGKPAGIARVIGDGRIAFFIKDVVVDPNFHGLHIGREIMENVLAYIRHLACPGAVVGLMSTPGKEPFYEQFGFIRRPSSGLGSGLVLFLEG